MKLLRTDGGLIFEADVATVRDLVALAVKGGVNLHYANLRGADLRNANLCGADLYKADLFGANLSYTNLRGAQLEGAKNITQWQSPQGGKRLCYSVNHTGRVKHQIGCFWGDTEEAARAIQAKYGKDSIYERVMRLNAEALGEDL